MNKCLVNECNRDQECKGLCKIHYMREYNKLHKKVYTKKPITKICIVDGCGKRRTGAKGYCKMHYNRLRRNGDINRLKNSHFDKCLVAECVRSPVGRGYCRLHYNHLCKTGDPLKTLRDFWPKKECRVTYCHKKPDTGGYCQFHEKLIRPFDSKHNSSIEDIYGLPPYFCYLCGTSYPELSSQYFQLDHLIPKSRGGFQKTKKLMNPINLVFQS